MLIKIEVFMDIIVNTIIAEFGTHLPPLWEKKGLKYFVFFMLEDLGSLHRHETGVQMVDIVRWGRRSA